MLLCCVIKSTERDRCRVPSFRCEYGDSDLTGDGGSQAHEKSEMLGALLVGPGAVKGSWSERMSGEGLPTASDALRQDADCCAIHMHSNISTCVTLPFIFMYVACICVSVLILFMVLVLI